MIGVGYRRELASWIDSHPAEIECLEITAEHFFHSDRDRLAQLGQLYRIGAFAAVAVIAIIASFLYQRFLTTDPRTASGEKLP